MARAGRIYVGVGGWVFEPWRESFYPPDLTQKDELGYMSRHVTSIEINATYYGAQKRESFARWREETPEGFRFSVKGPRFATNRRVLAESAESVSRFLEGGVAELGEKLGSINWQFMATKAFDPEDFGNFLALLPESVEGVPLRHAVEVCSPSFADPAFVALAKRHGVAVVLAADSDFPLIAATTGPFSFVRLMGTREDEPEGYSSPELDRWAARLEAIASGEMPGDLPGIAGAPESPGAPRDVYCYVIDGFKPRNPAAAGALIARLGRRPI
jgi:uncharacterized protein YecE (DUF72 family)